VAQVFARDYPHLCQALVICGTGGHLPATVPDESLVALREAGRGGDKPTWSQLVEQIYCAPGFAARQPQEFAELLRLMWPPSRREARWDARVAPSVSYWGLAAVPTLLIYGEQDRFGTPLNADDLQSRLAHVHRLDIADAGHFVIREATQQIFAALQDFAARLAG
jgi:pimeloyl-ACP methyl ester carboxylesterase